MLALIPTLGPGELMVVGLIAVLLFGSRLPSVARSMGKSFIEFKKGMRGIEDEVNEAIHSEPASVSHYQETDDQVAQQAPRFEPPKEAAASAADVGSPANAV